MTISDEKTTPEEKKTSDKRKYRIFISYAREDESLAQIVANVLEDMGHAPIWDVNISPGKPFTEAIKGMIERSHLFISLLTLNSEKRPWVHQETGYAIALNIPVLPLANETTPNEMTASLQAICIGDGTSADELRKHLEKINLDNLVLPKPIKPAGISKTTEWPETRAETLVHCANWLGELNELGHIRYRGALSPFSIYDCDLNAPYWECLNGNTPYSNYFHSLMREEHRVLKNHVMQKGCSLLIYPDSRMFDSQGEKSRAVRLRVLRNFIKNFENDTNQEKFRIVFSSTEPKEELLIVGDFFFVESMAPQPSGNCPTIFNSHAPTVLEKLVKFDAEFNCLYEAEKVSPPEAVERIDTILASLPPEQQCPTPGPCKDQHNPPCPLHLNNYMS